MTENTENFYFESSNPLLDHFPRRIGFKIKNKNSQVHYNVPVKSINVEIVCASIEHATKLVIARWYGLFNRIDFRDDGNTVVSVPGGAMVGHLWPHRDNGPVVFTRGSEFLVKISLPMPFGGEGWFFGKDSEIEVETCAYLNGMNGSIKMNGFFNHSPARTITEMHRTGLIGISEKNSHVKIDGHYGKSLRVVKIHLVSTVPLEKVYLNHRNADKTVSKYEMRFVFLSEGYNYVFDEMSKIDSHDQSAYECQFECQFDELSKNSLCGFVEGVIIVEKNERDYSRKALEESKAEIKQIQEKIDFARSALKSLLQF